MLDKKMDEYNKENRSSSFPVILAEYCRTEDSTKFIFSANDKRPPILGLYDKELDIIEPAEFKYKIFSEISFWVLT